MNLIKRLSIIMMFVIAAGSHCALAAESGEKLFVNLSSDEINRSAMAINFSTRVLQQKQIPVTIFLNVEGVRLAAKTVPRHNHINGASTQEMLIAFMEAGGKVIVCPMCMKNVGGLTKDQLIDGVVIGASDVTWPALFDEGTTVLSY